jgi:medium-chain acyl-[acyl-carrier-protein] hydrolase
MTTDTPDQSQWVHRPKPNTQARLRLFCFPYAGGGAHIFRNWADALPDTIELCAIQLPGRGARLHEAPFRRLQPMVRELASVLSPYLDMDFAFFGHSMGARISFELARYLRKERDLVPITLFISGCRAPQLSKKGRSIHDLPEDEFIKELRLLNGTPKEVLEHPELMRLLAPIIRADFEVCETYEYSIEPPVDCPLTVFGGLQDREANPEELMAWREQATVSFRCELFAGDHFFLHSAQSRLLAIISEELNRTVEHKIRLQSA